METLIKSSLNITEQTIIDIQEISKMLIPLINNPNNEDSSLIFDVFSSLVPLCSKQAVLHDLIKTMQIVKRDDEDWIAEKLQADEKVNIVELQPNAEPNQSIRPCYDYAYLYESEDGGMAEYVVKNKPSQYLARQYLISNCPHFDEVLSCLVEVNQIERSV